MTGTGFANRYQSVLVPVIFEPWARELIRRAAPREGETILDLGCGTGVVSRLLAETVPDSRILAVDHSAEMLAVARTLAAEQGFDAAFVEADAGALPFEDKSFDRVFCQQALQFFPDRPAAVREVKRILKPGGRAIFCVQRELAVNPMLAAQASALDKYVGLTAGDAVRAICGFPDATEQQKLFEDAGFGDIHIESVTLKLYHPDAHVFAQGAMGGMHTGDKLAGLADDSIEKATGEFLVCLGSCYDGMALRFPHVSNVIEATA